MASSGTKARPQVGPTWKSLLRSLVIALGISVVVVLLLALVLRRSNIVAALASPSGIAIIVAAVVFAVGLRFGLTRLTGSALVGRLSQLIPLALVVWFLIVPLVRETTVDEALPTAEAVAVAPGAPGAPAPSAGAVPPVAPAPVERARGAFQPLDHTVSGDAVLLDLGNGSQVVRFENFTVQPGPDYIVYVVSGSDVQRPDGGTELGALKGTRGSQNYALPASGPGSGPITVLIWCRAFTVPVANATLTF